MVRQTVAYGNTRLLLPWDDGHWHAVLAPLPDERPVLDSVALRRALNDLHRFLRGCRRIVLVVPDITRAAGLPVVMPTILELLSQAGIDVSPNAQSVRVLVALGIHRPMSPSEIKAHLGEQTFDRVSIENHNCTGKDLVRLGETTQGVSVSVNRAVTEADLVVLIGTTTYHYVAGYGGGRKLLVPGLASAETASAAHRLMLHPVAGRGWHPCCRPGVLQGNPVHACMAEAAGMLPSVVAITALLNEFGHVASVHAGRPAESLSAAVKEYDFRHRAWIERRAEVVVAGAGGFPRDINLIQAHKALAHAREALAPGGSLVLIGQCRDGLGYPTFRSWFDYTSPEELESVLRTDAYQINGQTAYSVLRTTTTHDVLLLSDLPEEDVRRMRMTPIRSLDEAADRLAQRHGADWRGFLLPCAGAVLPTVRST